MTTAGNLSAYSEFLSIYVLHDIHHISTAFLMKKNTQGKIPSDGLLLGQVIIFHTKWMYCIEFVEGRKVYFVFIVKNILFNKSESICFRQERINCVDLEKYLFNQI